MIIQCPSCGARAKIPESKEGAKVRCAECERVYVARDAASRGGRGGRSRQSSSTLPIAIGGGAVALLLILLLVQGGDEPVEAPEEAPVVEAQEVAVTDDIGWDSPIVKRLRKLHDLAYDADEFALKNALDWDRVHARLQREDEDAPLNLAAYEGLTTDEKDLFRTEVLRSLTEQGAENLIGSWKPFDGSVEGVTDDTAVARLALEPRSPELGEGTRNVEWLLVRRGGKWLAWSWERWYSERELKTERIARSKSYEKKTLSDGSKVIEGEPGPLPYWDQTSPELRTQIDGLIVKLMDLELPAKELSEVKAELLLNGKHAIPPLLTRFYELNEAGFADMDDAIRAQLVHAMLGEITGYVTTFSAHEALGASKERRDSGVRQWFGWYNRKFKRFETRTPEAEDEGVDPLEAELLEGMSERERRDYEKQKRIIEQQEAAKARRSGD
jgi:predicted Zn finger-like uncharacterized protein